MDIFICENNFKGNLSVSLRNEYEDKLNLFFRGSTIYQYIYILKSLEHQQKLDFVGMVSSQLTDDKIESPVRFMDVVVLDLLQI